MREPVHVIVVTDGDPLAAAVVERACADLRLGWLGRSQGSPTPLDVDTLVRLARRLDRQPVVVMIDDHGHPGRGVGERLLERLLRRRDVRVEGILAVASRVRHAPGIDVASSVDRKGREVAGAVSKDGRARHGLRLQGDTLGVLRRHSVRVVGIGDLGKMGGADRDARVTTVGLKILLEHAASRRTARRSPTRVDP